MPKLCRSILLGPAALACLLAAGPAGAASDHLTADASQTTDPDILRGPYDSVPPDLGPLLPEPIAPFFITKASIGLRGSYIHGTDGDRIETILAPAVTVTHQGRRSTLKFDANAELVRSSDGASRIANFNASGISTYALDRSTTVSVDGALQFSQPGRTDFGVGSGVAVPAQKLTGTAGAQVEKTAGYFVLTARGEVGRISYGPTTRDDGTVQDNAADSETTLGGSFRLGFRLTPRLTVFADGSHQYELFDAPTSAGYKLDGTTDVLRGGVSAQLGRFITAEGSLGVGLRRYAVAGLPEISSNLYAAKLSYQPNETFSLSAAFDSKLAPPKASSAGLARVQYQASLAGRFMINDWLALRASAAWSSTQTVGTGDVDNSIGYGLGVDYRINRHATLAADYTFTRANTSPDPTKDEHRITLGLVISN